MSGCQPRGLSGCPGRLAEKYEALEAEDRRRVGCQPELCRERMEEGHVKGGCITRRASDGRAGGGSG